MEVGQCPDITGLGTNVQITYQLAPDVLPVNPLVSCNEVVLPPIQVVNPGSVTGYFTQPNGAGCSYLQETLFHQLPNFMRIAATLNVLIRNCNSLKSVDLLLLISPRYNQGGEFILPAILGTNVSATASYYTNSGGSGTAFVPGDTIRSSQTLYVLMLQIPCV